MTRVVRTPLSEFMDEYLRPVDSTTSSGIPAQSIENVLHDIACLDEVLPALKRRVNMLNSFLRLPVEVLRRITFLIACAWPPTLSLKSSADGRG